MALVEVEFRDGARLVPAHVADMLERFNTLTMTYQQALAKANTALAAKVANDAMQKAIDSHRDRFSR